MAGELCVQQVLFLQNLIMTTRIQNSRLRSLEQGLMSIVELDTMEFDPSYEAFKRELEGLAYAAGLKIEGSFVVKNKDKYARRNGE